MALACLATSRLRAASVSPSAVDAPGSKPPCPGSITTVVAPYTFPDDKWASPPQGVRTRYREPSLASTMVTAPVGVTKIDDLPSGDGTMVAAADAVVDAAAIDVGTAPSIPLSATTPSTAVSTGSSRL